MKLSHITLDIYAIIVTSFLMVICILQRDRLERINKYLISWQGTLLIMFILDVFKWRIRGKIQYLATFKVVYIMIFISCYIMLIFYHIYLSKYMESKIKLKTWYKYIAIPIALIMSIVWIANINTRVFYLIAYNAVNVEGPFFMLAQIPAFLLLISNSVIIWKNRNEFSRNDAIMLSFFNFIMIASFPLELLWDVTILYLAIVLALLCLYGIISTEANRLLAETKVTLMENRIAIAMSQIQPHFLYNTLGTIEVLCKQNPDLAGKATRNFANYLRMNLDSMNRTDPIPFSIEFKHIETYLWIEKLRFQDKLNIEYDIETTDFKVPALSIQPIVENAVKHGICKQDDPGLIKISVKKKNDYVEIEIKDDGIGFDTNLIKSYDQNYFNTISSNGDEKINSFKEGDGRTHLGIENVKQRLKLMSNSTIDIRSKIGIGTIVTIRIPV